MNSISILLVDDNKMFLEAAGRFLKSLGGVEVVGFAVSAEEALTRAAVSAPDLMLMDIAMPGMNGIEAVRRMKSADPSPKAVMLTLHDGEIYRFGARCAGADGYLTKDDFVLGLPPLLDSLFPDRRR